jgi:hypothetical protein
MEDVVRRRVGLTPALWDFLKDGPIGLLRLEAEDAAFGTNMILSARVQASVAFREDGFPWPTCHPLRPMDRPDDAAAAPRLSA